MPAQFPEGTWCQAGPFSITFGILSKQKRVLEDGGWRVAAGVRDIEPRPHDLLPWGFEDPIGYHADYDLEYEPMIEQRSFDWDTLTLAMSEAKQWFNEPGHSIFTP